MIRLSNISKSFGKMQVLKDISLEVKNGQIYGLIGYNGVGKTTLMKIICGIYRPDSGKVWMDQKLLYENAQRKSDSFFMTEEISAFSQATLDEMRKFYKGYYSTWSDTTYRALVEVFHMKDDQKIGQFSKGMQRQAGLILAFSSNVKHLFLDEAFDGLDFGIRRQVRQMMRCYAKEKNAAILVSSHNLNELEELADQIGMLSNGKKIYDDSTQNMKEQFQVCRTYPGSELSKKLSENETAYWLMEQDGMDNYILPGSMKEIKEKLKDWSQDVMEIRPIRLEEFFQKERNEGKIDWEEIFKMEDN